MIDPENRERPEHIYPVEPWRMVEQEFAPKFIPAIETLFTVANGYIGIRGTFDEGTPARFPATFVNGFYESWPIHYGEDAFGFARTGQTIVSAPDGSVIRLYVDDEPFNPETARLLKYERSLNMQNGTLEREVLWETPAGKQVAIKSTRLVSLKHRHLAAIHYEVTVLNADAPVLISTKIVNHDPPEEMTNDPRKAKVFAGNVLNLRNESAENQRVVLGYRTQNSRMSLGCGIDHHIQTECNYTTEVTCDERAGKVVVTVDAEAGKPIRLTKYISYHTSRSEAPARMCDRVNRTLNRGKRDGFDALLKTQKEYLDDFWSISDVQVDGEPLIQQTIRFNLFHICQATARAEGVGVPAKGLTGNGYEGHYFWDAEIYVLPFLTYTSPRIARNLLRFRHSYLDKARKRAKEVNQKGALFPWRTINGEEASAYYAAGTAQYHINADIIYAIRKYVDVTGDESFLEEVGAEMLIETARLWYDLGFFSDRKDGKFCIHGVTGPDEYNTVVNNNTYTNLMARENLWYASGVLERFQKEKPQRFKVLVHRTKVNETEIQEWRKAADAMYVPYDKKLKIHPQDDEFLDRELWDFENTPRDKYPLLLHYHPLVIYRHQVIKQADIVMAMFLLGDEFSHAQKKLNFEYYDPLTTGDSSLSACIQSILAFETNDLKKAITYARRSAFVDLADIAGNVKDGCHIASMGGLWMTIVYGFAGMRDYEGVLSFRPKKAEHIHGLKFALRIQERVLQVDINFKKQEATYLVKEGDPLSIYHFETSLELQKGTPRTIALETKSKKADQKQPS